MDDRYEVLRNLCGCGKKLYDSKLSAERRRNVLSRRSRKRRRGMVAVLRAYPCPENRGWHLTSQPKSGTENILPKRGKPYVRERVELREVSE